MDKYIDVKNIITSICNQSGLSLGEICGVLNECLAEVRFVMLNNALVDCAEQKEQIAKLQAELAQLKEGNKDVSEEESE